VRWKLALALLAASLLPLAAFAGASLRSAEGSLRDQTRDVITLAAPGQQTQPAARTVE